MFPPELVDTILARYQAGEVRGRLLPPRLTVDFALARALFCPDPCREVLRTLAEAARHQNQWGEWRRPDKATAFRARRKLGVAPMSELLVLAGGAVADARTPGAFWRGLRLMAVEGTTLPAADTEANEACLGRPRTRVDRSPTGYPLARMVGSSRWGPMWSTTRRSTPPGQERVLAERLAGSLRPGMLVMAEHGLPDAHLWQRLATTGADLLWRIPAMWTTPVEQVLPDGSWISTLRVGRNGGLRIPRDVRVRVVECVPEIAGRKRAGRHHLITRSWTSNGSGHGNDHALRRTRA